MEGLCGKMTRHVFVKVTNRVRRRERRGPEWELGIAQKQSPDKDLGAGSLSGRDLREQE